MNAIAIFVIGVCLFAGLPSGDTKPLPDQDGARRAETRQQLRQAPGFLKLVESSIEAKEVLDEDSVEMVADCLHGDCSEIYELRPVSFLTKLSM